MRTFVRIDGGIGRCIAATGILKRMKEESKLKDVSVVTSFPYVFDGILDRVYPIAQPYLYEDFIRHGQYFAPEPYTDYRYYREKKHLIEVFNYQLTGSEKFIKPEIILSPSEEAYAFEYIKALKGEKNKKVLLIQPYAMSGGFRIPDETYRSIDDKTVNGVIESFKKTHVIIIVKGPNQAKWSNTIELSPQEIRRVFAVIPYVDCAVCCDSFLHHAIEALGNPIPTVVLWGGTSEKNLGYKKQINMRVMDVECEPNRVPHNHSLYVNKNKGCNDFSGLVKKIKEAIGAKRNNIYQGRKNAQSNKCDQESSSQVVRNKCKCSKEIPKGKDSKRRSRRRKKKRT